MPEAVTLEQVHQVATRLFAGLGYDMTTLDLVADALGVPTATVVELTGGKRELYLQVINRGCEEKYAAVRAALAEAEPGRDAVHRFTDAYLDFYAEHPDFLALWTHRWVSDASDVPEIEDLYLRPLLRLAAPKIRSAVPDDIGPYGLLGIVLWCVSGFLSTGILAPGGRGMIKADDPDAMKFFRDILHIVIDRMLAPPQPHT